jgi:hypothetical protein
VPISRLLIQPSWGVVSAEISFIVLPDNSAIHDGPAARVEKPLQPPAESDFSRSHLDRHHAGQSAALVAFIRHRSTGRVSQLKSLAHAFPQSPKLRPKSVAAEFLFKKHDGIHGRGGTQTI